jgi:general secretion pathway protein D
MQYRILRQRIFTAAAGALVALLAACAGSPFEASDPFAGAAPREAPADEQLPANEGPAAPAEDPWIFTAGSAPASEPASGEPPPGPTAEASPAPALVRLGTGRFVAPHGAAPEQVSESVAGEITLNFEEADLRMLVKQILGDVLGETYVLDPAVKGKVTIQNTRPLGRNALLPLLESLLQMHGAALVRKDGVYQILPLAKAARAVSLSDAGGAPPRSGFATQIVPLRFASAEEVGRILEPYVPDGGSLRAVPGRNILIVAGPGRRIGEFVSTVEAFDVDWIAGMTMGMFPLVYADARTVAGELEAILGGRLGGPMAGMVELLPVERLNAILVVTPQRRYLEDVKSWLEELDRGGDAPGRRLYVYEVRNGKAEHMADVLTQIFDEADYEIAASVPRASVAPGLEPVTIGAAAPRAQPCPGSAQRPRPAQRSRPRPVHPPRPRPLQLPRCARRPLPWHAQSRSRCLCRRDTVRCGSRPTRSTTPCWSWRRVRPTP